MKAARLACAAVLALAGCGGAADDGDVGIPVTATVEPASEIEATVEPAPATSVATNGAIPRSDAVPSIEELLETGLSESQAVCFRETIDPDGTGRVASAELFGQAFGECLGAQG